MATDTILIDDGYIAMLEGIFAKLNCKYIYITSGYRTPEVDKAVGGNGAPNAPHVIGIAADFICIGQDGKQISSKNVMLAIQDLGFACGAGYMAGGTHIDNRGAKCWFDETQGEKIVQDWYAYFGIANPNQPTPTPAPKQVQPAQQTAPTITYFPACNYTGTSIVEALISLGLNSSREYRTQIAHANGLPDYQFTADQNTKMLNLLKQGKLIKH